MRSLGCILLLAAAASAGEDLRELAVQRQRRQGYAAALAVLERGLAERAIAVHYTDVAVWAGEEARALERLRAAGAPLRLELTLLWSLRRLDEAVARANAQRDAESERWFAEQAAFRRRLAAHARRARWVALGAALALGLAALTLFRLAPSLPNDPVGGRGG